MRKCRSVSHKTTYGMHLFWLARRSFLGEDLFVIGEEAETGLFEGGFSLVWHNC